MDTKVPLKSETIAFSLNVSEKTVLKYLKVLKADLIHSGAEIQTKQRVGTYLDIKDSQKFSQFLEKFMDAGILDDPEVRKMYVLMRLMAEAEPIDLYEFSDELAVSPTLLRSIIKELKPIQNKYHLHLEHNTHSGYRLTGNEADIRKCLSKEFKAFQVIGNAFVNNEFSSSDQSEIRQIIVDSLQKFNIAVSSENIDSLTLHLLIAIIRFETDKSIVVEDNFQILSLKTKPEYYAGSQITSQINQRFHINLPESEIIYFTMHLMGKQRVFTHELLHVQENSEALIFYNRFLRNIYKNCNEDFFQDEELRTNLLNHISPFLSRVQNNMLIDKSELLDIKHQFPYAYDLAVIGLSMFEARGIIMPSAEISYFALHLQLSLEKRNTTGSIKYNILVFCDEVSTVYQLLSYKLNKYFSDQINEIRFASESEIDSLYLNEYQLILSVSETTKHLYTNALVVSHYLDDTDIQNIRHELERLSSSVANNVILRDYLYLNLHSTTKEDIIHEMTGHIHQYISLPDNFTERILTREKLATTELNHYVAIPHPITTADIPSFICVGRLAKPIIWEQKQVQLVFLVSSSSDINPWFYGKIAKIINHADLIKAVLNTSDFEEFRNVFEAI